MNQNNHDDDDDEAEEFPVYDLDEETRLLIETACNCLITLAEAQIHEEAGLGLIAIADALADRFALDKMELEQHHHKTEDGEEVLLAPKGGVFPDAQEPETGEAPAIEPE
jgi:hypothetical protein